MKSEMKVPGGKLIRAECDVEGGRIRKIKITGDFFLHPEDAIEGLEKRLVDVSVDESVLRSVVGSFFKQGRCVIVGATPEDFAMVIAKAAVG